MTEVIFPGPEGRLEGILHLNKDKESPIALVLAPDPQLGVTMRNRIVHQIHYLYKDLGFTVMRINYRGVGRSQGVFDNGVGELSDAASALDYVQQIKPDSRFCWVAGYGFGAYVGMQLLMRRPEIVGFISIAPPANKYDFTFLAPCPSSGLVINGTKDRVCPPGDIEKFVQRLKTQKGIVITHQLIEEADHVFKAHQDELMGRLAGYLRERLGASSPRLAPPITTEELLSDDEAAGDDLTLDDDET